MKIFGCSDFLVVKSLALLLLHALGSKAWPTMPGGTQTPSFSLIPSARSALNSIDMLPTQGLAPDEASARSVHKRMMPNIPGNRDLMHKVGFTRFSLIVPIKLAAKALEEFYVEIAVKATTVWATLPQRPELNLQQGNFRLNFQCIGDTIPWNFVKEMADLLWECACREFTDLFEVIYMNRMQTIAVKVWLEIVERSSGDSNSGVREGSVPSITSP